MSLEESIRIVPKGEVALVEFDLVGEKVNKLSSPVMARLRDVVRELQSSNYKAAVLISRKSSIFIAGADIEEIKNLKTKEGFQSAVTQAHEIFNSIEDLKIPVVAAIHGACMGGGCELILACDDRVASDDPATRIGLPEVKLGIIPGFGGCVRLPRVVGLQAALDIILQGKAVDSRKAEKIGLVDAVVHPKLLEAKAIAMAQAAAQRGKRRKTFAPKGFMGTLMESPLLLPMIFKKAREATLKATSGHYPAPLKAIDVIAKTYGSQNREQSLKIELDGFCEVAVTDVSKNLIQVFYLMESVKKKTGVSGDVKGKDVKRIGVLGAGTMGGGIAYTAADKGIEVRIKDVNNKQLALAFSHARALWDKALKRKRLDRYQLGRKLSLISGGLDYAGFRQLDVVIEAVVEDMGIKQKVIGETARNCRPDTVIATNTSTLSVTEMAKGHPNPKQFLGMHFFHPVDRMPLVEVIRGPESSDEAVATVFELAKKMGKIPVVVKDGPGFVVNRILIPYMIEAVFLLEQGMAIEVVDRIMKKEFGMPMGPYHLMDEVGLDVSVKVVKIFRESLGERIEVPSIIKKLADQKERLGKKSGLGFYKYENGKQAGVDPEVYNFFGLSAPTNKLTADEVKRRLLYPMVNEAALALIEERLVDTPEEVDLAMITGTGFPPFRGGLLRYADFVGTRVICDELEVFATKYGIRFRPSQPLKNLAKNGKGFYLA